MGELLGPLLAGFLASKYGYPRALAVEGTIIFFFSVLYLPVAIRGKGEDPIEKKGSDIE